jgi:hypothetical protein
MGEHKWDGTYNDPLSDVVFITGDGVRFGVDSSLFEKR